jgi:type II secretory pathway pseudopilin PulG
MIRRLIDRLRQVTGEAGFTLAEAVVTVAVVSVAFTAFAVALSTGAIAVGENDRETVVQGLARSQLEYVKGHAYDAGGSYPTVDAPDGYAVAVGVTAVPGGDADIQRVTANITQNGELLLAVSDYKVNR